MGLFKWLSSRTRKAVDADLTQGAMDFLEGRKDTLTSADIDPEGAEKYANYVRAVLLKKDGDIRKAAMLLMKSCEPPSIYKGHYEELFKIWRQLNREDLKNGKYEIVANRVLKMIQFDDEMIIEMLSHWGEVQKRRLPKDCFDSDRNLKVTDAKALLKAGTELKNEQYIKKGLVFVEHFSRN